MGCLFLSNCGILRLRRNYSSFRFRLVKIGEFPESNTREFVITKRVMVLLQLDILIFLQRSPPPETRMSPLQLEKRWCASR